MTDAAEPVRVVGVAVVDLDDRGRRRVLAARRTAPAAAAGGWELPGGKCDPGEGLDAAAVREIEEELGCRIEVTGRLAGMQPIAPGLTLEVVTATLVAGVPVPTEHDAVRWLSADELDEVRWLPADVPFLAELADVLRGRVAPSPRVTAMADHTPEQRLMLVHAHPDDESINNGATMARYVAEGRGVTLVTCTLGEEGEVLVPELSHLAADKDDGLGAHRVGELEAAMAALGVTDFRYLGGAGHYRDSGMAWDETGHAKAMDTVRDDTFWRADLTEAATLLVEMIREVRPQVLVTYDEFGNYGHPDHVQAHRVAMYGAALAAVPSYRPELGEPWDVAKIYWVAMSLSRMRKETEMLAERGIANPFEGFDLENPPRFMVPDEAIACEVDGTEYADVKLEAMKAHATQIQVDGPFFALSNSVGNHVWGLESYRLAKGRPGPVDDRGWETDLFAGL